MIRLLYVILLLLFISNIVQAKQIQVGSKHQYKTIKAAIDSALDGDTIFINSGMYKECPVIVDKKITMIGVDRPILDGEHKHEVVSIKADSVVFKGFRIQNSGVSSINDIGGIKVYDRRWVSIVDNVLDNNFFAIYLQYSKHCLVKDNIIKSNAHDEQNSGNGIHCWKSDSLQIIHNVIEGHRDGIYFEFVKESIVWRNIARNNIRYGLHFMFSHNDSYFTNIFENNGAGIAVMYTKHVFMANNTFINNTGDACYGLLLKDISDSYIKGNRFQGNTIAMFLEGANRNIITKNIITENGWGMKVQANCEDNQIFENNFTANTFDVATNGSLVMSYFKKNYWDKYEGYDLDKDGIGDIPYHPLSVYSYVIEQNPISMLLFRSFMVTLMDRTERLIPSITPEAFVDLTPAFKPYKYD
ncbi:MAG TPA: nitrous oxide reductase family maturation protein NosD, partial [Saprospiraceae bacterium]|nr:nitrous oxide reductase family maturation protein NosD [Saprospiraceae bacterium]HRO08384.1 nitrous oxide reductase family maturation protein NosD [Saprospiraceae bacterium]HRO72627.1 nitrous oxide reductase family maturation protein NosD [Saprospiraceae bacterium]HRP41769.1 nitrous oxide reductase family maturation protein NosD [Saprospiraceae bacterium]